MTNEQAKELLKAKLECLKRETSGTDFDCNNSNCDECSLCYEQGNMRAQKEAIKMAIKALEQQPEIIRCKECLWRVGRDCTRFTDLPVCMDDYCGRAKRRD